jgi:hypothetical protein
MFCGGPHGQFEHIVRAAEDQDGNAIVPDELNATGQPSVSGRGLEAANMKTLNLWMKHTGSCLPDCPFDIEVDEHCRHVVAKSNTFDSALFARLVTSVLPEELGVVAFRDDNLGWVTPPAPYSLEVRFGGLRFKASVVKLMKLGSADGRVATRLEFIPS